MITKAELIAALPAGDVKTWWETAGVPDFPAEAESPEFMATTLTALWQAQISKNAGLQPGTQIASFAAPTYGAIAIDPATGLETALKTCSVVVRAPLNPAAAVTVNQ